MKFLAFDRLVRWLLLVLASLTICIAARSCDVTRSDTDEHGGVLAGTGRKPLVIVAGQTEQIPSADYLASPGGVSTNGATANPNTVQTNSITSVGLAPDPTNPPTATANGAGNVDGVVQYEWTWFNSDGETLPSPVLAFTASHNIVQVGVDLPKRAMAGRNLYRTASGGSTFGLVHQFTGGSGSWGTIYWNDNTPDGSRGRAPPSVNSALVYSLEGLGAAGTAPVKTMNTNSSETGPGDLTLLTGDAGKAGAYAVDSYGEIFIRTVQGDGLGIEKTGATAYNAIDVLWHSDIDDGSPSIQTLRVEGQGAMVAHPITGIAQPYGYSLSMTIPGAPSAPTAGMFVDVISATSDVFGESAAGFVLEDGYHGSGTTQGLIATNHVAATHANSGLKGISDGAGAMSVGITGVGVNGTHNIGVIGSLSDAQAQADIFISSAIIAENAATGSDLFVGLTAGVIKFEVQNGGHVALFGVTIDRSTAPIVSSCGTPSGQVGGATQGAVIAGAVTSCTITLPFSAQSCLVGCAAAFCPYTLTGGTLVVANSASDKITWHCSY